MRKIIPLQLLTVLLHLPLLADSGTPVKSTAVIAASYSYMQGPSVITNFYEPGESESTLPALPTTAVVPIYNGPQSIYTTLPANQGAIGYGSSLPSAPPPPRPSAPPASGYGTAPGGHHERIVVHMPKPQAHYEEPTYFFPGLVRHSVDRWVGSDYLYDLPSNIGVVVELIVSHEIATMFNAEQIRDEVNEIFTNAGINPLAETIGEQPPLPFFNLTAFIVAAEDGFVLTLSGRLFEQVKLPRTDFQLTGTWQAITWEKQELVVTSKMQLNEQLHAAAREIVKIFTDRVNLFKQQRLEQRKELKEAVVPKTNFISPFLHPRGPCCTR